MKSLLLIFFLLPALANAGPERSVYPNSGTTDARRDDNADISTATIPTDPQKEEEKTINEKPKKNPDDFTKGPYDSKGNYRYIPEVKE